MLLGAGLLMLSACGPQAQKESESTVTEKSNSEAVIETIMSRRSIRKYKPEAVNRDTMKIILDCGINAPNGQNKQSWAVRVVDNPEFLNGVSEVFKQKNPQAAGDPTCKGIGSCCLASPTRFIADTPEAAEYLKRLEFPEGYKLLYCIAFGYPDEAPAAKPRDTAKVKYID